MENNHLEFFFLKILIFLGNFLKGLALNAQASSNIEKTPTPW